MEIEATFKYNSSVPYNASVSLKDINNMIPDSLWRLKNLIKGTSLGFVHTDEKVNVGNGTFWTSKFSWLRAQEGFPINKTSLTGNVET